jgi:hypothetical protein
VTNCFGASSIRELFAVWGEDTSSAPRLRALHVRCSPNKLLPSMLGALKCDAVKFLRCGEDAGFSDVGKNLSVSGRMPERGTGTRRYNIP